MEDDIVAAVNETLRHDKYSADMNLAQHAWDANNLIRTQELLDLHRPKPGETDLRGFEWFCWNKLCQADLTTLAGHGKSVLCVSYGPDCRAAFRLGHAPSLRTLNLGFRVARVPSGVEK